MYYAANALCGGFEIVNDVIRRTLSAAFRFESMTCADQKRDGAGAQARVHIGAFVPHKKRARKTSRQRPCGIFEEAGLRLTAATVILWPMRTDVDSVQCRAVGGQELHHASIDRAECFGEAFPTAHRGLIADHRDRNAKAIQHTNALGGPRQQLHAFDGGQVMPFDIDRSIAIKKNDQAGRAST